MSLLTLPTPLPVPWWQEPLPPGDVVTAVASDAAVAAATASDALSPAAATATASDSEV